MASWIRPCRLGHRPATGRSAGRRPAKPFADDHAPDPLFLSRPQRAWVISWHILLPAFTVGLASDLAVIEGLNLMTGRETSLRISRFWTRIFAVSFGMGVVSGIIMPCQFGTNWSRFSDAAAWARSASSG